MPQGPQIRLSPVAGLMTGFSISNHLLVKRLKWVVEPNVVGVFHGFGGHVFAAGGDDEVFLPPGDDQVPEFEDFTQVTDVKPAVVGEGLFNCGWVIPIAVKHGSYSFLS